MRTFKSIAVYCGSSGDVDPQYLDAAREAGRVLAQRGIRVVYGGGRVGTMGAVADAALSAGGEVVGVIPERLHDLEVAHHGLSELRVVDTMATRKAAMIELSDAFLALPGGFGTLEEWSEVVSLSVLNYQDKPTGLVNTRGFYDHLINFLDHATGEGFIRPGQHSALCVGADVSAALDKLSQIQIKAVSDWL